jgi:hypothetical protein
MLKTFIIILYLFSLSLECSDNVLPSLTSEEPAQDQISKLNLVSGDLNESIRHLNLLNHHHHPQFHSHHHHQHSNPLNCTDCYFLSRYCRNNSNLPYPSLLVNSSQGAVSATGGGGLHASFPPWMSSSIYENSPLLSPSGLSIILIYFDVLNYPWWPSNCFKKVYGISFDELLLRFCIIWAMARFYNFLHFKEIKIT